MLIHGGIVESWGELVQPRQVDRDVDVSESELVHVLAKAEGQFAWNDESANFVNGRSSRRTRCGDVWGADAVDILLVDRSRCGSGSGRALAWSKDVRVD